MQKTALIFPGQGSQTPGMGRELAQANPIARATFEEADEILGFSLTQIMRVDSAEKLNETINTQPALFTHSLAAYRALQTHAPALAPAFVAGHSLGQLSAACAAGALPFAEALRLVRRRGELMQRAGELNPGGMAAILNLDIPTLDQLCAQASTQDERVQVANDNSPGQVVISGHKPALERAMEAAKAAGARRAIPLAVSIAAHSPLMASIQTEWDEAVEAAGLRDAHTPLVGNVCAHALTSAAEIGGDIRAQMQSRVRWVESVQWLTEQGVTQFIEVGTGAVLAGLVKRISAEAICLPLGNPQDFDAIAS
jgi:[acyl-carrier-protein] S-malonyltransferase